MTAEAPARRRRFGPVPVRLRITAAVVLLAGLALTGAGLAVYAVESQRIDAYINEKISHEIADFEALQREGEPSATNPRSSNATRRPTTSC
jgi:hypothetical protein